MSTPPITMAPSRRDPRVAAVDVGAHALLNCYLREATGWWFEGASTGGTDDGRGDQVAMLPVLRGAGHLRVALAYRSPTYRHRFHLPAVLVAGDRPARPVDLVTLVALLVDQLESDGEDGDQWGGPGCDGHAAALVARVLDSVDAVASHLAVRADEVDDLWSPAPLSFGRPEQALLLGHPVHPTPKSRGEMGPRERRATPPSWPAASRCRGGPSTPRWSVHDSATGTPATELVVDLLRDGRSPTRPRSTHALVGLARPRRCCRPTPARRTTCWPTPASADLFDSGAVVVDLGPLGTRGPADHVGAHRLPPRLAVAAQVLAPRAGRPTRMRVTLPKELGRAVEAARLAATEVGARAARRWPRTSASCTTRPTWRCAATARCVPGFSVLLRDNRWRAERPPATSTALTTLCQDHPGGGPSRLGAHRRRPGRARTGRPPHEVGREWFARFCEVAVRVAGAALPRGRPVLRGPPAEHPGRAGGRLAGARRLPRQPGLLPPGARPTPTCAAVIPGLGEVTESIFPEALADERLVYYLFLNLTLGVVNALGAGGLRRRGRAAGRPARPSSRPSGPGAAATRPRCSTTSSTTTAGRARPTCAPASTTSTSWSATSPPSRST